jgi:hypothetical protein
MDVDMTFDSGSTRSAHVHPDVETVRVGYAFKEFDRQLRTIHQLQTFIVI